MKTKSMIILVLIVLSSCSSNQEQKKVSTPAKVNQETPVIEPEQKAPAGKLVSGTITTIVDGENVQHVNIWAHKTERKTIVTKCYHGEKVTILEEESPYIKLLTESGKQGWCMDGFVNK